MKLLKDIRFLGFLFIFIFALFSAFIIITTATNYNSDRHLVLLADQFLKFNLSLPINSDLPVGDVSDYFSTFYLYFGPLPSIILMPFVLVFGKSFPQVFIGIFSLVFSFIGIYKLSRVFKFNSINSLWLSLFFVFSTVIFASALINISAFQVEVMAVPFLIFALYEYFSKKRFWLIGLLMGLAFLTRPTLVFASVFFISEFFFKRIDKRQLLFLMIPIVVCLSIFGIYNFRRYGSVFEMGYKYSRNLNSFPLSNNLKYGYTSISHIPANLYVMLIKPPEVLKYDNFGYVLKFPYLKADPWGMAIWFTSPLFLVLLFKFKKNKYSLSLFITIISILIPIVNYFSIGYSQFGYRYAMDFLPFLFLVLIMSLNANLTKKELLLITLGVVFNAIYITSLWSVYPVLGIK